MNIKLIRDNLIVGFMILFATIGAIMTSIVIHEYNHYADLNKYSTGDEYLCGLVLPQNISSLFSDNPMGDYSYQSYANMSKEIKKAQFNSEIKSYALTLFVIVVFCICVYNYMKDKTKLYLYEIFDER